MGNGGDISGSTDTATKERNTLIGGLYCGKCFEQGIAPLATHCGKCGRRFLTPEEAAALRAEADKSDLDRALDRLREVEPSRMRLWLVGGALALIAVPSLSALFSTLRHRAPSSPNNDFSTPSSPRPNTPGGPISGYDANGSHYGSGDVTNTPFNPPPPVAPVTPVAPVAVAPPPQQVITCYRCHGNGRCRNCYGKGQEWDPDASCMVRCVICAGTGVCGTCEGKGKLIKGGICPQCGGSGSTGRDQCGHCAGTGQLYDPMGTGRMVACMYCAGLGSVPSTCSRCDGTGHLHYVVN